MSHSFKGTHETHFHYNSDFSGDVEIVTDYGTSLKIPAHDLLEFVAHCYVAPTLITQIEDASEHDLLTGQWGKAS